jgi:uncharacterized protein (DUF983 family)
MSYKESIYFSILNAKCPVCHKGDVYYSKQIYNIREFDKMHTNCSVCGHKYEIENGFFYGAMYVSYAITVAFSVAFFLLTHWFWPSPEYYNYIINIVVGIVVIAPITYRGSRLIWMNLFSKYNPNAG